MNAKLISNPPPRALPLSLYFVSFLFLSACDSAQSEHMTAGMYTISQSHGEICVCLCLNGCERRKEKETGDNNVMVFLRVFAVAKTGAGSLEKINKTGFESKVQLHCSLGVVSVLVL